MEDVVTGVLPGLSDEPLGRAGIDHVAIDGDRGCAFAVGEDAEIADCPIEQQQGQHQQGHADEQDQSAVQQRHADAQRWAEDPHGTDPASSSYGTRAPGSMR
jgi:hypothetical protein